MSALDLHQPVPAWKINYFSSGLLNSDTFSIFRVNFLSFHGSDTRFTTRRRYNYSLFALAAAQYFLTLLLAVPLYTLITLYIY
jgi:hypothetical protein